MSLMEGIVIVCVLSSEERDREVYHSEGTRTDDQLYLGTFSDFVWKKVVCIRGAGWKCANVGCCATDGRGC